MLAKHLRQDFAVNASSTDAVLCVDLDGTLVQTDTLLEAILRLLKREPRMLFALLFWLLKGRSYLKREVAARVNLNPAELPYCAELIAYLETEREAGTHIVLVTGADQRIAKSVAEYLGIFDEVIASNGIRNLTGATKMRELVDRFGAGKFRYVGNSRTDLPVWRQASHTLVCGATGSLMRRLNRERIPTERVFLPRKNTLPLLAQAMRVYQWPKNLLILVPLCLSHKIGDFGLIAKGLTAMAAFSLCASALYLINDLLDLAADRAHPRKRTRPFASGRLSLATGILLAPCLVVVALSLASFLPLDFLLILGAYVIL